MPDKIFDPEKIVMIDLLVKRAEIETPEGFDVSKITGYNLDNSLQLGFNIEEKLARTEFQINLKSESNGQNDIEVHGRYTLVFLYLIDNLEELLVQDDKQNSVINPLLASALASLTYSTARGILMTRLQGTAFQKFILPVVDPSKLILADL